MVDVLLAALYMVLLATLRTCTGQQGVHSKLQSAKRPAACHEG